MTHYINRRLSAFIGLVTLIVLLVGAFFVVKAMEIKEDFNSNLSEVPYYYTGPETTDITVLQDLNNWSTDQEPDHTCGRTSDIPCFIMADSENSLNSKLQACADLADVLDQSPSRRESN